MPDALKCIASLVKISNKFDLISVGYVQKTAQKQPKIILSAGMKTSEVSKLENYKSGINETCPRYLSPEHLQYTKTSPENVMKLRESRLLHHLKPVQIMLRKRGFFHCNP